MANQGPLARMGTTQPDLRDMLLMAGIGQYNAVMSIPYMNMLPSTTEPYAQGVLQLVKGLQRLLNQRGERLTVDGGMGANMVVAIAKYSGPRWDDKSWAQIYADVITGQPWQGIVRRDRSAGANLGRAGKPGAQPQLTPVGDALTDLMTNPIALAAGGFAIWWTFFRKKRSSGGSSTQKLLPAGDLEDL